MRRSMEQEFLFALLNFTTADEFLISGEQGERVATFYEKGKAAFIASLDKGFPSIKLANE